MTHGLRGKDLISGSWFLILCALAGILGGGAAATVIAAARAYAHAVTSLATGQGVEDFGYLSRATPALALVAGLSSLVALLMALAVPETRGASIDELLDEYHHRAAEASLRGVAVKVIATPLAVGGGAPVGILGPVAFLGGSIGGLLGKVPGIGFRVRRKLFLAGIAGAVSWALRAPLGAVFFALEIPYHRDIEGGADSAIASALGSFSSFLLSVLVNGMPLPTVSLPPAHSPGYVVGIVLVGLTAGLAGRAFSRAYHFGVSVSNASRGFVVVLVPSVTAALVMASPLLSGSGLSLVQAVLGGAEVPTAVALLIIGTRLGLSPLLSGAGLPGGLFGPGLLVGSLLGLSIHNVTGLGDDVSLVVVGMASFYGAISTTPIAMSVIAAEVSGNYFLAVPSLIASLIAREVIGRDYLYINQKDRRLGEEIALARDLAEELKRAGVYGLRAECPGTPSPTISLKLLDPDLVLSSTSGLPSVVTVDGYVAGVVSEESLARYLIEGGELIVRVPVASCGEDIYRVVDLMVRNSAYYVVLVRESYYYVLDVKEVVSKLGSLLKTVTRGRVGARWLFGRRSHLFRALS